MNENEIMNNEVNEVEGKKSNTAFYTTLAVGAVAAVAGLGYKAVKFGKKKLAERKAAKEPVDDVEFEEVESTEE